MYWDMEMRDGIIQEKFLQLLRACGRDQSGLTLHIISGVDTHNFLFQVKMSAGDIDMKVTFELTQIYWRSQSLSNLS